MGLVGATGTGIGPLYPCISIPWNQLSPNTKLKIKIPFLFYTLSGPREIDPLNKEHSSIVFMFVVVIIDEQIY